MKTKKQIQKSLIKRYLFDRNFQTLFPIITGIILVLFFFIWFDTPNKETWWDVLAKAVGVGTICTYLFCLFNQTDADLEHIQDKLMRKVQEHEEEIEHIQSLITQDAHTEEDLRNLLRIKNLEKKKMKIQWEIDLMTISG